jgi:site-specific recombinase XerC
VCGAEGYPGPVMSQAHGAISRPTSAPTYDGGSVSVSMSTGKYRLLSVLHRFFPVLQAQGQLPQQPHPLAQTSGLAPQALPRPMAEEDLIRFFQVMDALRNRTMCLRMLRCGLRVGEVSALTWPAIHAKAGSIQIDTRKGQVDRVAYASPDVEQALRQWRHWQPPEATYVLASPLKHGLPLGVRAIQHLMAKYLTMAQIAMPYSPHALRQSPCDPTAECGSALRGAQRALSFRFLLRGVL